MYNLLSIAAVASVAAGNVLVPRNTTACNNSPDLCDKSYGEITHLGAHDSPFWASDPDTESSANQRVNSTTQLSAGVRLLTAQVHNYNDTWELCHSSCLLYDAGTLKDWLADIKGWLDDNTNEVVTILLVNSDDASNDDLVTEFEDSGITDYAYTPDSTDDPITDWPTLQTLIDANTRLLTFVASLADDQASSGSSGSYLMDEFTYVFENNYEVTSLSNFTCDANRPTDLATTTAISSGYLPLMNHFLDSAEGFDIETPDYGNISITNSPNTTVTGALGAAAQDCKSDWGRQPTFILVDFFDVGPALDTVDSLNNVTDATGRTSLSSSATVSTSGAERTSENTQNAALALLGLVVYMVAFM